GAAGRRRTAGDRPRGRDRCGGGERPGVPGGDQPRTADAGGRGRTAQRGHVLTHRIGVIRGDGTGPEVVAEALKVLEAVRDGFDVDAVEFDLGADRYLRTGEVLPADELEGLRGCAAILLGAVGDPRVRPGILERDLLLRIRF